VLACGGAVFNKGTDDTFENPGATATAGPAVIFAGLTVVIALLGLSAAGIAFLTTMGLAAAAAAIAVAVAVTLFPALMAFAGKRVRPKAIPMRSERAERPGVSQIWVWLVVVVASLAVCALPAADLRLALPRPARRHHGLRHLRQQCPTADWWRHGGRSRHRAMTSAQQQAIAAGLDPVPAT
jgi:hypothetical protein